MQKDFLTGRESSILALLAQTPNLPARDRDKFLGELDGIALQVAKALTGLTKRPSKEVRAICKSLRDWSKECGRRRSDRNQSS